MNKNVYISLCVLGMSVLFSCEKTYDHLIPSQYDTILVLKEVGEQNVTLYSTGEDGEYDLTILKSGNAPDASAQVKLQAMSDTQLEFFSQSIGRKYKGLPSSCYQLPQQEITFSPSEKYKKNKVVLKTNAIKELLNNADAEAVYVLPLELVKANAKDSVNAEKKIVLVRPEVLVPVITYTSQTGTIDVSSSDVGTYDFTLSLPFVSPWDFECEVALPDELLNSDEVFFENGNKVIFKKGRSVSEPVQVKAVKMDELVGKKKMIVPIKVVSSSKTGIELPQTPFNLGIVFEGNKIPLTTDMLYANTNQAGDGGGLPALIDNNPATYYHSQWSPNPGNAPHFVMVSFQQPVSRFAFSYQNRNNANGKPQDIDIFVKIGEEWKSFTKISSGLPTAAGSTYDSRTFMSSEPVGGIAIRVMKTNSGTAPTFFSLAELAVYGK